MERLCISSFLINRHAFQLYVYDGLENVPAGASLKDAGKVIGLDKIFKYKGRSSEVRKLNFTYLPILS